MTKARNPLSYRGARRNALRAIGEIVKWRVMQTFQIAHKVKRWIMEPNDKGVLVRILTDVIRYQYVHYTYRLTMTPRRA